MSSHTSPPKLISSVEDLKKFLSSISSFNSLYIDLEGINLCRHGTISLITILVYPENVVRLVDVAVLGNQAFTVTSDSGKTLKSILEDPNIPKFLWDVRNDADALWALYRVGLAGVTDVQLLENATRFGDKTYLRGLARSIQYDCNLGLLERNRWLSTKEETTKLMSTGVFAARPLDGKTIDYCVNDVIHLPELRNTYMQRINKEWLGKVKKESAARVVEAHRSDYDPLSPTKKFGPWGRSGMTRQSGFFR
jgi:exonuclease 3'-5' domain-containing protein 1